MVSHVDPTQILALIHQIFSANPQLFNYLLDYADNTAVITNLVDGLLENDKAGNRTCSLRIGLFLADGLTYTYKLRKDAMVYSWRWGICFSLEAQILLSLGSNMQDNSKAMDLIQNLSSGIEWDYAFGVTNDNRWCQSLLDDYTKSSTLWRPES